MDPMTLGLLIGAGVGITKSELIDRPKEKRQRKLAAETQRLSPWTGLRAQPIQEADALGAALAGGISGQQIGTGMSDQTLNEKLVNSQIAKNVAEGVQSEAPVYYQPNQYSLGATPYWSQLGQPQQFGMGYGL